MRCTSWISSAALIACLVSGAIATVACGSSPSKEESPTYSSTGGPEKSDAQTEEERRRAEAIRRHHARQEAACDAVSQVLTSCAIQDARASMSPEEFAKLDVERLAPAHRAEFMDSCTTSDMSVRQIEVFEQCVAAQSECPAFLDCLDQARPQ